MALVEGCKHRLEINVPAEEVEREDNHVVEAFRGQAQLPGFRQGKVPASMIRSKYKAEIRRELLEALVPKALRSALQDEDLSLVGTPDIKEVHLEKGEPLRFTAEFEVAPEIELGDYLNLTVKYEEPEVTDEDVTGRIDLIRNQKADYINVDPRPAEEGDFAVVSLKSLSEVEGPPIEEDEMMLHIGSEETLKDFSDNIKGMEPGQEKEFDVSYPEGYGQERLSGKTVRFHVTLKVIRRKELPELNDDFAQDLGDYKNIEEVRDAVRSSMQGEREMVAQQAARDELVGKLVDLHDFALPEVFIQRQIDAALEAKVRELMAQGIDPKNLDVDWQRMRESQRDGAIRQVKASLLLDKIGEREAIEVTPDEVDAEVQRYARSRQEPVAATRKTLEEAEELPRIASRIRTEKTLTFLFEKARKVAGEDG